MAKTRKDAGVFQLNNGNWGFRFKFLFNGKTVDRRRTLDSEGRPFKSKTEAIRARKAAIQAEKIFQQEQCARENRIKAILAEKPSKRTVAEIYTEYCLNGRKGRAYQTKRKQDSIWRNHLDKRFGKRFIDEISSAEVMDYLTMLYYEEEYSFRYVESFLKFFYLLFGQAYSRNYMSVDVYNKLCVNKNTKIHMPKLKIDEDLDIVVFTKAECAFLEDYFTGTNAETAYRLGRYCGLRINECYGLKWSQVDLKEGFIYIEQQMTYQEGLIKLVPLKTRKAKRKVYLNQKMIEYLTKLSEARENASSLLKEQRNQNQRYIIDVDGKKLSSLELVNTLPSGKMQTVNSMKFHSKTIKSKGINFKYHYLRHTFGTYLADKNIPAHLLCNQMGHGKIETTQKYYIALSQDGIDTLIGTLDEM